VFFLFFVFLKEVPRNKIKIKEKEKGNLILFKRLAKYLEKEGKKGMDL
jgi:hypothetical protein